MKNVVRIILIVIAVFVAIVQTRPNTYRVERSTKISAPSEAVFNQINDFHNWPAWSPWGKLDPGMKTTFEGPEAGEGAAYRWTGNNKVGEGSMKITGSTPSSQVVIDLEFLKPFKDSSITTFSLAQEGDGTTVNWSMEGRMTFISKAMCIFMSMDKMVGPDFERGLTALKGVVESAPAASAPAAADATAPAAPAGTIAK
jgi:hypothetical protein